MIKKLIPNIILFFIITGILSNPAVAAGKFSDVIGNEWHSEYIYTLRDAGIINGFPDGTFRPDDTLNADQFIKMTVKALGYNIENGTNYWASSYIKYAQEKGLLDNSDINDFKKPLIRGEVVCIIARALEILQEEFSIENCELYDLYGYTPDKYIPDVLKVYNAGIIVGYPNNTFGYENHISRAEACTVINKFVTPITRRERQVTSLTPVPVCYSYKENTFEKYINEYPGNKNCLFRDGVVSFKGFHLETQHNPLINKNITDSLKILLDNRLFTRIEILPLADKNIVEINCFDNEAYAGNSMYSMFNLKFYDAPTGYPEKYRGYDTMKIKLEINRLSSTSLLNKETGRPDTYYEYKIRGLMRLLFGIEKGDVFSSFILDRYIAYSLMEAGEIQEKTELLAIGNTSLYFFSEGNGRQLCFTFSEDSNEK